MVGMVVLHAIVYSRTLEPKSRRRRGYASSSGRRVDGVATSSSECRVDGEEIDAMICTKAP